MYGPDVRARALALLASGKSMNSVSRQLAVSRAALRDWKADPDALERATAATCVRCRPEPALPDGPSYAHLLGLYLGDGCVSAMRKGVYSLRIACCDEYPRLIEECVGAVRGVHEGTVFRVQSVGCTYVTSLWKHWPCLFPQHGPGRKHTRRIALEDWQKDVVQEHPGRFLRGLFHSDGCRITNWTTKTVGGTLRRYEYPRYFFSNASADIRGLCCWALGLLDVPHRHPSERTISVARRAAVARLDEVVGPK